MQLTGRHVQRLTQEVGADLAQRRDEQAERYRRRDLPAAAAPPVAVVEVDGGRLGTRRSGAGPGVHEPQAKEDKIACLVSVRSDVHAADPQPEPPAKLLRPVTAARLAAELKTRRAGAAPPPERRPGKPRRRRKGPRKLVRTVAASRTNSDAFGYQMAAEVQRRRLGEARRKGRVCDGQKWSWTPFALHLPPWGFVGVLDFLHLVSYLYAAAQAAATVLGKTAWALYERWLRWAWAGQVRPLLAALREAAKRLGPPSPEAKEDDPRRVAADAVSYVTNDRDKMNYPEYRRLGLPIRSAPVESVIKQSNRRVKGSEKFWTAEGGKRCCSCGRRT